MASKIVKWNGVIIGAVILLLSIAAIGGALHVIVNSEDNYEYNVKAEQVNEDEMVDGAIDYDTLSEVEQEVLFNAFKESDHFLGGSEAYVETDQRIDVSGEWRVVEVEGVPILVAISGPDVVASGSENAAVFLLMFGAIGALIGLRAVHVGWP